MTDKDLKKMSRAELLELLLIQTKEVERLQVELADARQALDQRRLHMEKAGSIAEAALSLSGIFEAAQAAASQYLDNMEDMERLTRENCRLMEQRTREKCDQMICEAKKTAENFWNEIRNEIRDPYIEHERWMKIHSVLNGTTYEKLEF